MVTLFMQYDPWAMTAPRYRINNWRNNYIFNRNEYSMVSYITIYCLFFFKYV